jgi:hypothetical protein
MKELRELKVRKAQKECREQSVPKDMRELRVPMAFKASLAHKDYAAFRGILVVKA